MYDEKPEEDFWPLWLLCGEQTVGRQEWEKEGLLEALPFIQARGVGLD